jgi:uncharacterized protein YndB with AHSA1/START domain
MKTDEEPIIVEQAFDKNADIVWNSITDVEQMRQRFFDNIPSFKPEVGFETGFNVQSQDRDFPHVWKVTEVIPKKLIKYNWRYDGYPGDSYVVFELFKQNSSTLLRLTHFVEEDFPDDIPEFSRESGLQGWTYFIKEKLIEFLNENRD